MSRLRVWLLKLLPPRLRPAALRFHAHVTRGMIVGVRGLARDEQGRVLLVRHHYAQGWHLPGGGVEPNETAEAAVIREMLEETGLRAVGRPRLASAHVSGRNHILVYHIDRWEAARASQTGEIAETGWFAPGALPVDTAMPTRLRIEEREQKRQPSTRWDSAI